MRYLLFQAVDIAAERFPDANAIQYTGQCLTYAGILTTLSSQLAQVLIKQEYFTW